MPETLATIRTEPSVLRTLLEQGSAGYHSDLLIRIDESAGRVATLMQTDGREVVSYCTYARSCFGSVEGAAEALVPVGGTGADQRGLHDYLDMAVGQSDMIEMRLEQSIGEGRSAPRAQYWAVEGDLSARIRLPASETDFAAVPWDHPVRWTPDNQYVSQECLVDGSLPDDSDEWIVGPTRIETSAETIESELVAPAEFVDGLEQYPIVVVDEQLQLDVQSRASNDQIWGAVDTTSVEGPDVDRAFRSGFADIIGTMRGPIRLQTAPDGLGGGAPPISIVQDHHPDRAYRHVVGAAVGV